MFNLRMTILATALAVASATGALAQSASGSGCLVEEAAQAALQRELEMIEAAAADPEDSFSGPDSCINADIFQSLDLSMLIPDLSGFLSSFSTASISNIIQQAQQQACRAAQDAINDAVGGVTDSMSSFNSSLSDQLSGILDNGWGGLGQ